MDLEIGGTQRLAIELEGGCAVRTDVFVVRGCITVLVICKQLAVIRIRKGLVHDLIKDVRILELVGQLVQEALRADVLNHFGLALLLVKHAQINVEGAELRQLHRLFDQDLLPLAEGVPATQSVCYGTDLPHFDYLLLVNQIRMNIYKFIIFNLFFKIFKL